VRAARIRYSADRAFAATGEVFVRAYLKRDRDPGVWEIRCAEANGTLTEKGQPQAITASGGLKAVGPAGEQASGLSFRYDVTTGRALLLGAPAVLQRGKDLRLAAEGFDLTLQEGAVSTARTRGKTTAILLLGNQRPGFRRWRIDLDGPAQLEGERILIDTGARLEAYDASDKPVLRARTGRVRVSLVRAKAGLKATLLEGDEGVEVEDLGQRGVRVTAERLRYAIGSSSSGSPRRASTSSAPRTSRCATARSRMAGPTVQDALQSQHR
jgi:hypothetical protein